MKYIETRPEAISAIHQSITRWNLECYGCKKSVDCGLCTLYGNGSIGCPECPLEMKYGLACNDDGSAFDNWFRKKLGKHQDEEAMLEALVMLLPPKERKVYGG